MRIYLIARMLIMHPGVSVWLDPTQFFHSFQEAEDNCDRDEVIVMMVLGESGFYLYGNGEWTGNSKIFVTAVDIDTYLTNS